MEDFGGTRGSESDMFTKLGFPVFFVLSMKNASPTKSYIMSQKQPDIPADPSFIDNLISFPLTVSLTILRDFGDRLIGSLT